MHPDGSSLRRGPVAAAIRRHRLIAVLRGVAPRSTLLNLIDELIADGIRIVEVTLDSAGAVGDLAAVRARAGGDVQVGAGTIRTVEQLRAAVAAGAAFGVSPILDRAVLEAARDAGLPFVPGVATPTEADAAWRAGATFVKVFPASSLGPAFVRELRGPMPEIETVVTGGLDATNARAFLEAGAAAVGVGSALTRMDRAERRALALQTARS
ncbi:MAG TPA: bifunctional 4-hydroxy-2-oxoglutarate aldolase/2-dehydro-3-deoxy-phosphogluconate aldolase [Candidatus Limnocylindrales bacterium]|nr:bifunctional 4-hydroxy-2-oxoglutarate aldolase/2-dehydro-3-deoxy-phosphogluconate aldolase [Candidatus Limnocylindrales bacterium]